MFKLAIFALILVFSHLNLSVKLSLKFQKRLQFLKINERPQY